MRYIIITLLFMVNLNAISRSDFDKYGVAFFTSVSGDTVKFKNSKISKLIHLHDTMVIDSESLLRTSSRDYVFFKLSNNTTFGLLENTQFKIELFRQNLFKNYDISLDREPSTSYFKSFLNNGTILVKSNDLSALSIFEIRLPISDTKIEVYSAKAVISYKFDILHIVLYEGNISLKTNGSTKYINAPSYFVSDKYNLINSIKNHNANLSDAPQRWDVFKDYLLVEDKKVIFFPDSKDSKAASKAKLISTQDFKNKNFSRPRSFKKPQFQD